MFNHGKGDVKSIILRGYVYSFKKGAPLDGESQNISPLHYLRTDSTISPQNWITCGQKVQRLQQYCTACVHLIQSRRNIVLLVYT